MGEGCFGVVTGKPQPFKGAEVHEVEAATPIHVGLGEPSRPNQRVDYEGKPPWLGDPIRMIHSIKGDWRLGPVQVLQDRRAHDVDCPANKFELAT
jgi:hypothetical protein